MFVCLFVCLEAFPPEVGAGRCFYHSRSYRGGPHVAFFFFLSRGYCHLLNETDLTAVLKMSPSLSLFCVFLGGFPSAPVSDAAPSSHGSPESFKAASEAPATPVTPEKDARKDAGEADAGPEGETEEEKAKRLLYCSLCKVAVNSASQLQAHNSGETEG